jgi:hypothetical protein
MSTTEITTPAALPAELAATLPAAVAWLTAPGTDDTVLSVARWGDARPTLELVAERGPIELYIAADGSTAGLQIRAGADPNDLGPDWPHVFAELARMLADPRVAAQIERWGDARRAALLGKPAAARDGAAGLVVTHKAHVDKDGPYSSVEVTNFTVSLEWTVGERGGCLSLDGSPGDISAAAARRLRAILNHPEVIAWTDSAD